MSEMSIRQEHWTHATRRTYLATQCSADEHAAIRRSTHTGRPLGTPEFIEAPEKATRRKQQGEHPMKNNDMLTIASLLSILLLTLHVTDDIVRGISKAEPSNIALAVLVVLLYGTLVLSEGRLGHVIMLLVGLFAAGMPVIPIVGGDYPRIAQSPSGSFFLLTLWGLGAPGGFPFILPG